MTHGRADASIAALVWLACAAFYLSFDPFARPVGLDPATWDWMSLSLVDGRFPYRDVFLHKTPGAALIGAAGAAAAERVGVAPLAGVRAACLAFGAAGPALLYLLCRSRLGVAASLAAAAFMLSWDQWVVASIEGMRPKVPTTVLGLACLLAAEHRRWAAAGVAGGAATMCWQPGVAFLLGALWSLREQPRGARAAAVARLAVGAAAVPVALLAWLAWIGALADFYAQAIRFNFEYIRIHARTPGGTLARLVKLARGWNPAELALLVPAAIGALRRPAGLPGGLVAAGAAYLLLAFVSFQAWPDMILFSAPVAGLLAAGLAGLLPATARWQTIVLVLALALAARPSSARLDPPVTFDEQSRFMHGLAAGLAEDDRVVVVSLPEFMIHTGRTSVWKWPYMWFGVDRFAAEATPGGFEALLADLTRDPPALMIVARRWHGPLRTRFEEWAAGRYDVARVRFYPHTRRPITVYRLEPSADAGPRMRPSADG